MVSMVARRHQLNEKFIRAKLRSQGVRVGSKLQYYDIHIISEMTLDPAKRKYSGIRHHARRSETMPLPASKLQAPSSKHMKKAYIIVLRNLRLVA